MHTPVLAFYATVAPVQEWLPYQGPNLVVIAAAGEPVSSLPADKLTAAVDTFLSGLGHLSKES